MDTRRKRKRLPLSKELYPELYDTRSLRATFFRGLRPSPAPRKKAKDDPPTN